MSKCDSNFSTFLSGRQKKKKKNIWLFFRDFLSLKICFVFVNLNAGLPLEEVIRMTFALPLSSSRLNDLRKNDVAT